MVSGFIYHYSYSFIEIALQKKQVVLISSIIYTLAIFLQSVAFYIQIKDYSTIRIENLVGFWGASSLLNFLGPFQAGTLSRLAYLIKNNINKKQAVLFITNQAIINTSVAILLLLFLIFFSNISFFQHQKISILFFLLVTLLIIKYLSKKVIFIGCLLMMQYLVYGLAIWLIYNNLGSNISYVDSTIVGCLLVIFSIISLTPANIGIQDFIIGYIGTLNNLSTEEAITASIIFRLSTIFALCSITLLFFLKNILPKKINRSNINF